MAVNYKLYHYYKLLSIIVIVCFNILTIILSSEDNFNFGLKETRLGSGKFFIIVSEYPKKALYFNTKKKNNISTFVVRKHRYEDKRSQIELRYVGNSSYYLIYKRKAFQYDPYKKEGKFIKFKSANRRYATFKIFKEDNNEIFYINLKDTDLFLKYSKIKGKERLLFSKMNNNKKNKFGFKFKSIYRFYFLPTVLNKLVEEAKVDVVFTYIDLSDPGLNRTKKEKQKVYEEHNELKYSLRSVLKNIPWINKIFIIMPNEKVRFLQNTTIINEKIVYIKDKDFLGFDSHSSITFEFNLWRLKKFGVSNHIIYMNDDFFIGKPYEKNEFFYEENGKVLPVIFHQFEKVFPKNYERKAKIEDKFLNTDPHSTKAFKLQNKLTDLFLFRYFKGFYRKIYYGHTAISLNLDDVKEIYDLIEKKYEYSIQTLHAKKRNQYAFQFQSFYLNYCLNKYNRKVKELHSMYFRIGHKMVPDLEKFECLFCLNTAIISKINRKNILYITYIMQKMFPEPTKYEKEDKDKLSSEERKEIKGILKRLSENKYF